MNVKFHYFLILVILLIVLRSTFVVRIPVQKRYHHQHDPELDIGSVDLEKDENSVCANSPPLFHIFLIGCERLSLIDVYEGVRQAKYPDLCVALTVLLDQPWDQLHPDATTNFTRLVTWVNNEVQWPHGPYQAVVQSTRQGIRNTWLTHIRSESRYIVVLEDDLSVDSHQFVQSVYGSAQFLSSNSNIFAIALHAAPIVNEYIGMDFQVARTRIGHFNVSSALTSLSDKVASVCMSTSQGFSFERYGYCRFGALFDIANIQHRPVALQIASSWGTVFLGDTWRQFVKFAEFARDLPLRTGVHSDFWTDSWKQMATLFILLRGDSILYPGYHTVATRPVTEVGPSVHGDESIDPSIRVFLLSADMNLKHLHQHNYSLAHFPVYDIYGESMDDIRAMALKCSLLSYWRHATSRSSIEKMFELVETTKDEFDDCDTTHPYHVKVIVAHFEDQNASQNGGTNLDAHLLVDAELEWPKCKSVVLSHKPFCFHSDDISECRPIKYLPEPGPFVFEGEWTFFRRSNVSIERSKLLKFLTSKEEVDDKLGNGCWMGKCSHSLNQDDWILCRPHRLYIFQKKNVKLFSFEYLAAQLRDTSIFELNSLDFC